MVDVETGTGRFTVGVFQDVAWATKGLDALKQAAFPTESLTVAAKDSPEAAALIERTFGSPGERLTLAEIGVVVARGPLVAALQANTGDLPTLGVARTMRRV